MATEQRFNTVWARIGALILDGCALAPMSLCGDLLWHLTSAPLLLISLVLFEVLLVHAYFIVMLACYGQTFGKMATGLVVISHDSRKITVRQAIIRNIPWILLSVGDVTSVVINILNGRFEDYGYPDTAATYWMLGVTSVYLLITLVVMVWHPERRTIHDFLANTLVIRQRENERRTHYRKIRWSLIFVGLCAIIAVINLLSLPAEPDTNQGDTDSIHGTTIRN